VSKSTAFTRHYEVEGNRLWEALEQSLRELDKVDVEHVDAATRSMHLKTSISLFSWGQKLTATVRDSERGGSMLEVRGEPKSGFLSTQWGEDQAAMSLERKLVSGIESALG